MTAKKRFNLEEIILHLILSAKFRNPRNSNYKQNKNWTNCMWKLISKILKFGK